VSVRQVPRFQPEAVGTTSVVPDRLCPGACTATYIGRTLWPVPNGYEESSLCISIERLPVVSELPSNASVPVG